MGRDAERWCEERERRLFSLCVQLTLVCVYVNVVQIDPLCAMMNLDNAERLNLVIVWGGKGTEKTPKCVVLPRCHADFVASLCRKTPDPLVWNKHWILK